MNGYAVSNAVFPGSGGDNLGNHTATQDLDMAGHSIINIATQSLHFADGTVLSPSTMVSVGTVSAMVAQAVAQIPITQQVGAVWGVYPVFTIPLGNNWTDFELKADTNNFEVFTQRVYFIQSYQTNSSGFDDTNVWIHFTDDYYSDKPLQHRKSALGQSIASQLSNTASSRVDVVMVQPSHQCQVNWQSWMSPTNDKLVWAYLRMDAIGPEKNASGTKDHWNLIRPVEWRTNRINP